MREIIIHSWAELLGAVFDGVWDEKILRYRNNRVFRGVADRNWGLVPSLNRCCPHDLTLEKQIIRSFRKYGYADLQSIQSFWQTLALGQQFGLPTRLLDWTYSPLVAAHFATENTEHYKQDGGIVCVDMERINKLLPNPLLTVLKRDQCNVFSMEMLDGCVKNLDELGTLGDHPFALFFEPASTVNRIANQYALFSLTNDPCILIDQIPGAEEMFTLIVIDKTAKLEIRDKLDYINISERMIYPGLDGISRWIARRYAPLGEKHGHFDENSQS